MSEQEYPRYKYEGPYRYEQAKPRARWNRVDPLNNEERLAIALHEGRHAADRDLHAGHPTRFFNVGDRVHIGNLPDAMVEAVEDGKEYYLISYSSKGTREKPAKPGERVYRWMPWVSIFDPEKQLVTVPYEEPVRVSYLNAGLESLIHKAIYFGLNFDPKFQRDYVWTPRDKERLIESVMLHKDIGKFIFWNQRWPDHDIVVDGKQRLSTLVDFYLGKFSYKGAYFEQLTPRVRGHFRDCPIQYAELSSELTEKQVLKTFLDCNTAGVPQSEEHLDRVRELYEGA